MRKYFQLSRFEWLLLAVVVLPHLLIAFSNMVAVLDWYTTDDAFYYFVPARNIAAGNGISFDGLTRSNGFHPLWMAVLVPIFALAQIDNILPLRMLIVVLALLNAATGIVLFRLVKRYLSIEVAAFVAFVWALTPAIHGLTTKGGVEAGLNAFFILLLWERVSAFNQREQLEGHYWREIAGLGLIAAFTIFTRLDNIFLVFFAGLWLWLRWFGDNWGQRLRMGFAFFLPVVVIMLGYLVWNQVAFGTPTPVSGQIKLWWGTLDGTVYGFPVKRLETFAGQFFTDDEDLGPWHVATAGLYRTAENIVANQGGEVTVAARRNVLLALGGGIGLLAAAVTWLQCKFVWRAVVGMGFFSFFLATFAQITYYKAAGSMAQQPWYWVSETVFLVLVLGLLLEALRRTVDRYIPIPRAFTCRAFNLFSILLVLGFFGYMLAGLRPNANPDSHYYVHRPVWMEANTEPGARIAVTGAGNLGYFTEGRTIVNMDGLMNSYDYFLALQNGTGAEFLADLGVDYVFGNNYVVAVSNPYGPMLEGHLREAGVYRFGERELILWKFVP
ncbi:MAG: hypothetical protein DWQ07_21270 [Chloroflexi bacterium]|nr:MAG: hypothetical protein DWQ07_21270 [Chloroflexota bacterium]MBL1194615.1 hypothetical protein [Chloroflexota bacterium]NOH11905.1 hypothetical protein [Chloroflexota bacterium]